MRLRSSGGSDSSRLWPTLPLEDFEPPAFGMLETFIVSRTRLQLIMVSDGTLERRAQNVPYVDERLATRFGLGSGVATHDA